MASPNPTIVVMLAENMEIGVKRVSTRSAVNEPKIPTTPIASGNPAAVRLPKIKSSRTSSIGNERVSARLMSFVVWLLNASSVGTRPPTLVCNPGALRSALMASKLFFRSSSLEPFISRTANVSCPLELTNCADPLDQYVVDDKTSARGSLARVEVTALRKTGDRTKRVGLEYSTTTSPASRPNAAVARLLSSWL